MKRTTLVLEDACMARVRELARHEGRQISQVVNELLSDGLRRRQKKPRTKATLITFRLGRARANLADRDALEAAMER